MAVSKADEVVPEVEAASTSDEVVAETASTGNEVVPEAEVAPTTEQASVTDLCCGA